MKSEWIALDSKLREVERAQTALESQTIAVAQSQKAIADWKKKAIASLKERESKGKLLLEAERTKLRRIQGNERFAKWLDNSSWAMERFGKSFVTGVRGGLEEVEWRCGNTRFVVIAIAIHWLVLFPVLGAIGLRMVLSDRCLQVAVCREVLKWGVDRRLP